MDGSVYTAAGLVNDPTTVILDVFSKYDIYGPQMEKIWIIKIWGLQIDIEEITLCRNDLSLHLYQLYIRLFIFIKLLSKCFVQYLHVKMSIVDRILKSISFSYPT